MIRMKGSSLDMSFAPRGAGSSPAHDKTFLVIYLVLVIVIFSSFFLPPTNSDSPLSPYL